VETKVGDIYIRHSDGQIGRVKWIGGIEVVLEFGDERHLHLTDIFALQEAYSKRESQPTQTTSA